MKSLTTNNMILFAALFAGIVLIIILVTLLITKKKNNKKDESYQNINTNEPVQGSISDEIIIQQQEEKNNIPELAEEKTLNMEEIDEKEQIDNSYVTLEETQNNKVLDEDITNIFKMDSMIEQEDKTDTLTEITQNDIFGYNNSGVPDMPKPEELEKLEYIPVDKDILEETVELPKMANVEINNDITATKKCNNCGFENIYSQKNCLMCSEPLD